MKDLKSKSARLKLEEENRLLKDKLEQGEREKRDLVNKYMEGQLKAARMELELKDATNKLKVVQLEGELKEANNKLELQEVKNKLELQEANKVKDITYLDAIRKSMLLRVTEIVI